MPRTVSPIRSRNNRDPAACLGAVWPHRPCQCERRSSRLSAKAEGPSNTAGIKRPALTTVRFGGQLSRNTSAGATRAARRAGGNGAVGPAAGGIVAGRERTPENRRYAKDFDEAAAGPDANNHLRCAAASEVEPISGPRRRAGKQIGSTTDVLHRRARARPGRRGTLLWSDRRRRTRGARAGRRGHDRVRLARRLPLLSKRTGKRRYSTRTPSGRIDVAGASHSIK